MVMYTLGPRKAWTSFHRSRPSVAGPSEDFEFLTPSPMRLANPRSERPGFWPVMARGRWERLVLINNYIAHVSSSIFIIQLEIIHHLRVCFLRKSDRSCKPFYASVTEIWIVPLLIHTDNAHTVGWYASAIPSISFIFLNAPIPRSQPACVRTAWSRPFVATKPIEDTYGFSQWRLLIWTIKKNALVNPIKRSNLDRVELKWVHAHGIICAHDLTLNIYPPGFEANPDDPKWHCMSWSCSANPKGQHWFLLLCSFGLSTALGFRRGVLGVPC